MKRKQIVKLIRKTFKWWHHQTGLGFWKTTVNYCDDLIRDQEGNFLMGDTHVDWRYLRATVNFYPKGIAHQELDKEEIESMVIHELMHIFLNEMREPGIEHEERVATLLQKAFSWVRSAHD